MNTNNFKSYSSKASAVKGAKRAGVGIAEVQEVDGKWGYYLEPQETQETEVETPAAPALLSAPAAVVELDLQALRDGKRDQNCPSCGISLENGISIHDEETPHDAKEFACLACGHEFGPDIAKGLKIEKDRPTQNGVTMPSAGGKCRAVWELCDQLGGATNPPTVGAVKAAAPEGLNATNVQIEYYNWRKFHGIRGRIKPAAATQEAAE